jgi:glycosyltransferase involved in cell wall biosynthesis
MLHRKYYFRRTISFARRFAESVVPLLNTDARIVFSPDSVGISLLDTKLPKVFYTDATFAGIVNFYEKYTSLSRQIIEEGHYLERKALESSALAVYASEWAARSAIEYYHADPGKVKVVPFGANIDSRRSYEDIKRLVSLRSQRQCQLLFVGIDWQRKGGDLAVKVAGELNQRGLPTRLHVVGVKNLNREVPDFVVNHGFISKASGEGIQKLERLFSESHFLIVPSRAEAYGLVFCEASSFGLPSLSTNVGGISTVIRDGINGKTFSLDSNAKDYASFILDHFNHFPGYRQLAYSSFHESESRLNWEVAGKSLMQLLKDL